MPRKTPRPPNGSTLEERLAFFSIPEPNSGCLLWLGRLRRHYPSLNIKGVAQGAHRLVLEKKLGRPLQLGEFACHKCDVKLCIAEDHLFPGTHDENMADMRAKNRAPRGERSGTAKITAPQVIAIRADLRPHRVIAKEHGIHHRSVFDIKRRARWAHVA